VPLSGVVAARRRFDERQRDTGNRIEKVNIELLRYLRWSRDRLRPRQEWV
jgi:hypothetical protein